jgi:hypothetical protein
MDSDMMMRVLLTDVQRFLEDKLEIKLGCFLIHQHYPEDFLVVLMESNMMMTMLQSSISNGGLYPLRPPASAQDHGCTDTSHGHN